MEVSIDHVFDRRTDLTAIRRIPVTLLSHHDQLLFGHYAAHNLFRNRLAFPLKNHVNAPVAVAFLGRLERVGGFPP